MSMNITNDNEYNNNSSTNLYSSSSSSTNYPLMSVSSSSSSIYSDNSQKGFQPPLDNSQQCCCPPSGQGDHQCDVNFASVSNNSSKVSAAHHHSEFKATFYNPFETKHRRRTSRSQFKILEAAFEDNPKPSAARRQGLAEELDMTPRGVQIWFQNRRAKAKQLLDEGRKPDCTRQRSGSAPLSGSKASTATIGKPLYTEWDSQESLNVTKDDDSDRQHMTSPTSPPACSSINSGMTGIHPGSRAQAPHPYYTTATGSYSDAPCPSSSSSPVDPDFELPTTPTTALSPNVYTIAAADQQIYKPTATPAVYSDTGIWYDNCGFVEETNAFVPIAVAPSYGYQQQGHVSEWVQVPPARTQPLLWQEMPPHHQDATLLPWTTLDPHHRHYQVTIASTTPTSSSLPTPPGHSSDLYGVATTTAADNKNDFVDLARVFGAVGDYTGTNHHLSTSSFEPPLDVGRWPEMVTW